MRAGTANFQVEKPRGGQRDIADDLGIDPQAWSTRQQPVRGVLGDMLRRDVGGLLIGG